MTLTNTSYAPAISLEDEFGIVYLVENAQQFWSELEDLLNFPKDEIPTLSLLDSTLKRYLALCAAYHEQYLQSPLQLEHACQLLLDSELFAFHSERMCEILVEDTRSSTDPHAQFVFFNVLLAFGRRRADFFRSHKRWQPLVPLLMDHVLVEIDPDTEDTYTGSQQTPMVVPIEAKLRSLSVRLLYEVCRVQKLSVQDLRIFDDAFIDYLFDLVEQTRDMSDDSFNYSVIKLIVSLNEQFMVASLSAQSSELVDPNADPAQPSTIKNRVLRVLMRRLNSTKTFGENMIFMLNRAERTPEGLCMQLLVLKILYLLFTTHGTSEYFYTNDLCVLVDVFLRELVDLDEESESLRHTYLRVLHPLLTKTQLRFTPYKRPQIMRCLESLISNTSFRDINSTTKRLVERCLGGEWCVQLKSQSPPPQSPSTSSLFSDPGASDGRSSGSESSTPQGHAHSSSGAGYHGSSGPASKTLKSSKSVEHMHSKSSPALKSPLSSTPSYSIVRPGLENLRRPSNASSISLHGVASAVVSSAAKANAAHPSRRPGTVDSVMPEHAHHASHNHRTPRPSSDLLNAPSSGSGTTSLPASPVASQHDTAEDGSRSDSGATSHANGSGVPTTSPVKHRRTAPPPPAPPKRRKPPAVPVGRTNGGAVITAIKSSAPTSPLAR
ncbi:hypothetical protein CCMSSC00406_0003420 [Pleurotus cornucopiae]|uniref:Uncharacterized protein n=1 Tax=Pleurotus cornucopiae TaxID=5321 RepID=A0ACB7J8S1_PLECO|nr:hypothetical protein CCMSSC00406_0003420 [Pleurotus cornucopiae]